jgi:predicted Zn-dependent peptidase
MPNRHPRPQPIAVGHPEYQKSVLPNGLRVVTERIPSVRSVAVGVWVKSGSRDETAPEAGITHFIEHMVFKGTRRRRMHHIAQRMEAVGGYLNAFTTKESTCYYARSLDEHLERALDTVLDLIVRPTLPAKEIEKEKEVVIEEMKMYEDQPEDLIFDRFEELVYGGHPLGRPVLGYPETVRSFTQDRLHSYIERHYAPGRLVIAVAGNIVHEQVVRLVQRLTADLERGGDAVDRAPVLAYEPRTLFEERPTQQAHVVVGGRGLGLNDERRSTLNVLNTLLGGGMSSRLNQNIREKYGFCYNIYSFANLLSDTGDVGVYMGTEATRAEKSLKLIRRELDKLAADEVSPRQLSQSKSQLKGSLMLGLESMSNRMVRLGRVELTFERYFSLDEITETIESVTSEQVRVLAEELFAPERLSSVVFVPQA